MSSGSCMVMQSILIWMVFPADPSVGLPVKFSSMGWTEWMADLKHKRHIFFFKSHQSLFLAFTLQCCLALLTHWSSISNSWLNTSWLKESVVGDDWFWDMAVRKELSLQDKRDEGSLSLQGDRSNHDHIHFTTHILNKLYLLYVWLFFSFFFKAQLF